MKIVVLLSRVPYPLIKGDKLRAFNQIRELSAGHDIYLCCLNNKKIHPDSLSQLHPLCKEVKVIRLGSFHTFISLIRTFLWTDWPLQVGYFYQRKAKKQVVEFIRNAAPDHIYCQLVRTSEYVREISDIPKTLDYMDSLSSGMQRRTVRVPFYKRWLFKMETRRLKKYEHEIFHSFEYKTIISDRDRRLIVNYRNEEIEIIENGVNREWFTPVPAEKKYDLLFTGNMSYPPNMECVIFLVSRIMPLVWEKQPSATLVIAGANPGRRLTKFASDRVIFTGWVKDMRAYYNQSCIFIAPMQIGSGLQNKLLEAMSMNLPCITSDLANRSLQATNEKEILIGENPADYARLILELLNDPQKASTIASNGNRFVRENFDWKRSVQKLNEIFEKN